MMMLGNSCAACVALFGEMSSAVTEADAITEQARILIRASKPSDHVDEWGRMRERWEDVRQKRVVATHNLKITLRQHRVTHRHCRIAKT